MDDGKSGIKLRVGRPFRFWASLGLPAIMLFLLMGATPMRAQGCSACRDATAGSAPRVRQGLRRAIFVLGVSAAGLFVTVLLLARRMDQGRDA